MSPWNQWKDARTILAGHICFLTLRIVAHPQRYDLVTSTILDAAPRLGLFQVFIASKSRTLSMSLARDRFALSILYTVSVRLLLFFWNCSQTQKWAADSDYNAAQFAGNRVLSQTHPSLIFYFLIDCLITQWSSIRASWHMANPSTRCWLLGAAVTRGYFCNVKTYITMRARYSHFRSLVSLGTTNMANSSDILPSQLPNPFTPMAFLPPELAYQKTTTTYVLVGMLGVSNLFTRSVPFLIFLS